MRRRLDKRGNVMSKGKTYAIFALIMTVLISITAIVLDALRSSQTETSAAYGIADAGMNATYNLASQGSTVGTLLGVSLIVVVVVGGMLYLFKRGAF